MLSWSFYFLVIALAATQLGSSSLAGAATGIAETLFEIFLVRLVISLWRIRQDQLMFEWRWVSTQSGAPTQAPLEPH